jgi:DNA polymerase eta
MRAIIHLDLDAFYAQVEQVRLGLPHTTPLVCKQWFGILAVSYSARKYGISRSTKLPEALQLYPELVCAHVPTYYCGEEDYQYHDNPQKSTHKVSLDYYRAASRKIMAILQDECPHFEKASIDEAYLDVTEMVDKETGLDPDNTRWGDVANVIGDVNNDEELSSDDLQLYYAARIAQRLRARILKELGYTCSAGIAHNKTLAKLGSAMHKPNKQTVIRYSQTSFFLSKMLLSKIRGLGGVLHLI